MAENVLLLGATGSVGGSVLQALKILKRPLWGFSFHSNLKLARQIIRDFTPYVVIATDENHYRALVEERGETRVLFGEAGILESIEYADSQVVVNALCGMTGLLPSFQTLRQGKKLIIANKESIIAGAQVLLALKQFREQVIPIDSEHWSLFQLLEGMDTGKVKELVLTASGGPFWDKTPEYLKNITLADALKHPVWRMGKSITISSATMANKGMEILEAKELFGFSLAQIKAVIHPQAKIHAMLRLTDGSLITHVSPTTMVEPALHALTYPSLSPGEDLDIASLKMEFHAIKPGQFPMLELAYEAGRRGHLAQIVFTTANEIANDFFLREKIRFSQIALGVEKILCQISDRAIENLEDILRVDKEARELSNSVFKEYDLCPY